MIHTGFSVMTPISFTMWGWSNWRMVTTGGQRRRSHVSQRAFRAFLLQKTHHFIGVRWLMHTHKDLTCFLEKFFSDAVWRRVLTCLHSHGQSWVLLKQTDASQKNQQQLQCDNASVPVQRIHLLRRTQRKHRKFTVQLWIVNYYRCYSNYRIWARTDKVRIKLHLHFGFVLSPNVRQRKKLWSPWDRGFVPGWCRLLGGRLQTDPRQCNVPVQCNPAESHSPMLDTEHTKTWHAQTRTHKWEQSRFSDQSHAFMSTNGRCIFQAC